MGIWLVDVAEKYGGDLTGIRGELWTVHAQGWRRCDGASTQRLDDGTWRIRRRNFEAFEHRVPGDQFVDGYEAARWVDTEYPLPTHVQTVLIGEARVSAWRRYGSEGYERCSPGADGAKKNYTVAVVDLTSGEPVFTHWTRPVLRLQEVRRFYPGKYLVVTLNEAYQKVCLQPVPFAEGDAELLADPQLQAVVDEFPTRVLRGSGFVGRMNR